MEYDKDYWEYQKKGGEIGGTLNLFKFEQHIKQQDTVLDFGCGGGFLLEKIDCVNKMGFEVNDHAIARARHFGLNVTNNWDDIEDESIDKIISNHALEHILDPHETLKKLYKKLKPNGYLIFVLPCEQFGQMEFFYKEDDNNQHVSSWCPQSLGNLVKFSGFKVLSCDTLHHSWTHDWDTSYTDPDYHDRCIKHSKEHGVFQLKVIGQKV